jgi:hypothetical protein
MHTPWHSRLRNRVTDVVLGGSVIAALLHVVPNKPLLGSLEGVKQRGLHQLGASVYASSVASSARHKFNCKMGRAYSASILAHPPCLLAASILAQPSCLLAASILAQRPGLAAAPPKAAAACSCWSRPPLPLWLLM